jgi:hypothetical protein
VRYGEADPDEAQVQALRKTWERIDRAARD